MIKELLRRSCKSKTLLIQHGVSNIYHHSNGRLTLLRRPARNFHWNRLWYDYRYHTSFFFGNFLDRDRHEYDYLRLPFLILFFSRYYFDSFYYFRRKFCNRLTLPVQYWITDPTKPNNYPIESLKSCGSSSQSHENISFDQSCKAIQDCLENSIDILAKKETNYENEAEAN